MKFKDVPLNSDFQFVPSKDGFFNDRSVYMKSGNRSYIKRDSTGGLQGPSHRIGSINAEVKAQA